MPKPFPGEFRRDVVAVARRREAPLFQIAKDFGVSEATLHNWLEQENEVLRRAAAYLSQGILPK